MKFCKSKAHCEVCLDEGDKGRNFRANHGLAIDGFVCPHGLGPDTIPKREPSTTRFTPIPDYIREMDWDQLKEQVSLLPANYIDEGRKKVVQGETVIETAGCTDCKKNGIAANLRLWLARILAEELGNERDT